MLAGELIVRRRADRRHKRLLRQMEFYLPSVMERVVMAVSSGMDVIPALQEASRNGKDPISALLAQVVRLSECGASVDSALEQVARSVPCISVKHAFIHLGLAYRQGGEIVRPLKELSDATQVAYQESVEEVIAKLPVQAVLPLVVTFTGLIISFLTVPLMQVGSIATRVAHATR
jgi:pilus assembly protein TadC